MTGRVRRRAAAILAVAGLLPACASEPPAAPSPFPQGTPRLVLFLVVDQMSQEYLVRLRPLLEGGLAHLLDGGAVFADAHHNHANTVTGAGHATLASGCYPRRSGIISNQWYDRDTGDQIYCVQDDTYRRSPVNLLVDTLPDWLKDMDPSSKVFAASGKDRSAILTGGFQADAALWYAGGDWVTTGYYEEPDWLEGFNDRRWLDQYFGRLWEPLPVAEEALEEMRIVALDEGEFQSSLPYAFGSKSLAPTSGFYSSILSSPFSDAYLTELAKTILVEEQMGLDEHPDFLALGYHALDYVGHAYGPHSREVLDTILRLDRTLGELFDFIDASVGLDNVVIALSADHGVVPMPEYQRLIAGPGARVDMDDVACFQAVGRELAERYGGDEWLRVGLYLNDQAIAAAGIDRAELERDVAGMLQRCDGVERVWTRTELLASEPSDSASQPPESDAYYRQLYFNSYHPERSPDFEIQYAPYYLNRMSSGTSHGTPYAYDTWVPFVIVAPTVAPRRIEERVHTADMAPTIAAIMGITAPPGLDGIDRSGMMWGR